MSAVALIHAYKDGDKFDFTTLCDAEHEYGEVVYCTNNPDHITCPKCKALLKEKEAKTDG